MNFPLRSISRALALGLALTALNAQEGHLLQNSGPSGGRPSPYFLVRSAVPGVDALPLKSTEVKADITGVIANVTITQQYRNEGRIPLEALYIFPGSTQAAIHAMTMTIGERRITARISEKETARRDYALARSEGRTASLLEQDRPNVFQMQVANILPGDDVRVELSYSELLTPQDGQYSFVFPTVVGPRYRSGPGAPPPSNRDPGAATPATFGMTVNLEMGMPIAEMASPSHTVTLDHRTSHQAAAVLGRGSEGNRDFVLNYRLAGDQIQQGLLLHRGTTENFFLLMLQPPKKVEPKDIPPREVIFLVDVSGSMFGYPMETTKALVNGLIGGLRANDRFNVLTFAAGQRIWYPEGSVPATAGNRLMASEAMDAQDGRGGSELLPAFRSALGIPRQAGLARTIVLISDGYVDVEPQVLDLIRDHQGEASFFAFGVGTSVNRHLMEGIAHVGQGEAFVVSNPSEAPLAVTRFRSYVASPVLSQVTIKFHDFDAYEVEPIHVPDLLADRPLICFGKWRGPAQGRIEVSGLTGTGTYHRFLDVTDAEASERNPQLRHLWARHRIRALGDYGLLGGKVNQGEITRLGLQYGLITEFTSFLAEEAAPRGPILANTQVVQPSPLPARMPADRASGVLPSRPSGSGTACTVEVVASTPNRGGGMSFQRASVQPGSSPSLQLGSLRADRRDLPLARIRTQLGQRLRTLTRSGSLKGLPAVLTLRLQIDASGAITTVSGPSPSIPGFQTLAAQLKGWRFEAWATPGITELEITVEVKP